MNSNVKCSRYFMISRKDWIFQSEHRSVTVQIVTTCKIKNLQLKIQSLVLRRKPNLNSYSILSTLKIEIFITQFSSKMSVFIKNEYFKLINCKIRDASTDFIVVIFRKGQTRYVCDGFNQLRVLWLSVNSPSTSWH